jgi:hypothetical protein
MKMFELSSQTNFKFKEVKSTLKTKSCSTCNKNLSCQTQTENKPCFGCTDWEEVTVLSCPRSFSAEHVYDTSRYEEGKLSCLLCGLETTVTEARKAKLIKDRGF